MPSKNLRHTGSLLLYSILAVALTWPVALHLSDGLAGRGGDVFAFAWNLWWVKFSLIDLQTWPFSTSWLFHPFGTSLVFHTHTLANGLAALPLLCVFGVPAAFNLILYAELVSGAMAGCLIARNEGAGWLGSFAAGVVFGFSAHVTSHIDYGAHNLSAVGWLGFFLYFFHRTLREGRWSLALLAGVFLALTAYNDYTMLVFSLLAAGVLLLAWLWRVWRAAPKRFLGPASLGLVLAFGLEWKGNLLVFSYPFTLLSIFLGLMLLLDRLVNPGALGRELDWRPLPPGVLLPRLALAGLAFALVASPLLWAILRELLQYKGTPFHSDLLSQRWFVKPLGLLIPMERHPHLGWLHSWYWGERGTHPSQFLGLASLLLAGMAWARPARGECQPQPFPWLGLALCFLALSLGPWLRLSDDLRLRGPFYYMVRWLPFIGGIRAPLRFLAVVDLGLAVGAGLGLSRLSRSRPGWAWMALALLIYERWSVPFPVSSAEPPAGYRSLLDRPSDGRAVLELPLGFRTGDYVESTERTAYQFYQCLHGRPLVTGFVARITPGTIPALKQSPMLRLLEALGRERFVENPSTPPPQAYRDEARRFAEEFRIGYILIHETAVFGGASAGPVVSRQVYRRLLDWVPHMFHTESCGAGPDWACFRILP